jgi:hypothetical protein
MRGCEVDLERGIGLDLCPDLERSMREAAGAVDGPVRRALTCRGVDAVVGPPAVDEVVVVATAGVAEASGWEGKDGGMKKKEESDAMASVAVDPATGVAVMTFLVSVFFFTSGVLETFRPTLRGMGLGEGPAVGPVPAFDGKVGRGGGGGLAAFQATASEMLDGLVPAAFFYNKGALFGHEEALFERLSLAGLAVLPNGEGGEDRRGGDVEEDVDQGVEMGEDTCDSQRHRKCSDFAVNGVVGNGELPGGLNAMTPIFS